MPLGNATAKSLPFGISVQDSRVPVFTILKYAVRSDMGSNPDLVHGKSENSPIWQRMQSLSIVQR